ncbi:MAG: hypothetical protein HY814_04985, partial [Candidatus Riflebacteria bacterium]|nr:hypothetical protein [Candidatus Riflebacteria bacterium]
MSSQISRKSPASSSGFDDAAASWRVKTLDELAGEQGIAFPQDKQAMLGAGTELWDSTEDFHAFLAGIH